MCILGIVGRPESGVIRLTAFGCGGGDAIDMLSNFQI